MSITSRIVSAAAPAPSGPTFPGLFKSNLTTSVFLMSSPTQGVRVVQGKIPVLHRVGHSYTNCKGSMTDRVRRGEFTQIHTPLTIEFSPQAS